MTLGELVIEHPDWLEYEMVVYNDKNEYDFIGESGDVYLVPDDIGGKLIVFAGN